MANNEHNLSLDSLKNLGAQIIDGLEQNKKFKLPKNYRQVNNIVVSGMGGSNLAGRIIKTVFANELKLPVIINADYEIPAFVGRDTLFISSSYSGSTEETLHAYTQAKLAKAKIVVLTANNDNNKLAALAIKDGNPLLTFTPNANPSGQPRLGLGYAFISLFIILQSAGLLKINDKVLNATLTKLKSLGAKLIPEKSNNQAYKLSDQLFNKNTIIITGPFLAGNAHTLRNQFNENSKNLASYLTLSEMNHYALEGLAHPDSNKKDIACLFFESALYSPRIQKRLDLTKKVITKNKLQVISLKLSGKNKLEQSLEMLQLGAWLTYYLSLANKENLLAIPWVDWFKQELK